MTGFFDDFQLDSNGPLPTGQAAGSPRQDPAARPAIREALAAVDNLEATLVTSPSPSQTAALAVGIAADALRNEMRSEFVNWDRTLEAYGVLHSAADEVRRGGDPESATRVRHLVRALRSAIDARALPF